MEQCTDVHALTVRRPMEEWLAANDIPLELTLQHGELEVDEQAGLIRIEMLWRLPTFDEEAPCGHTREAVAVVGGQVGTVMREYPLKQPMSPELAQAYQRARVHDQAEQKVREAVGLMRDWGAATVVTMQRGDHLVFVAPNAQPEFAGKLIQALEPILPGVGLTVVAGVTGVIHSGGELGHLASAAQEGRTPGGAGGSRTGSPAHEPPGDEPHRLGC